MSACVLLCCTTARGTEVTGTDVTPRAPPPRELEAHGAIIGRIIVDPQNIFDLNDPKEDKRLYRLANALHISTREQVIRDQLLFKSGTPYSQRLLDESERILRSARYLYDASIKPIALHDGQVDVLVTTRDVWTLNPGISFGRHGGKNTSGFELEELNILGTGTSLSASHKSGLDRDSNALEFKDRHVGGSWVSLAVTYANNSDGSTKALALERPFYALDTSWAAGINVLDDERIDSLYDRGKIVNQFQERSRKASVFGGWSAGLVNGWTRRWTTGFTYDEAHFDTAPGWNGDAPFPGDRKFVYPWIGIDLIQDDFEKTRNRDQIGRTEDFHLGTRISARLGWAATSLGSSHDALIFDGSVSHGLRATEKATWLLGALASGRLEDGELANGVLTGTIRYYLRQSERRLFFVAAEGTVGHNLDVDNQVLLGGDNGLRGYPLRYQAGDARALLTVEQRYFTNWYPFRLFRIGGAAFFDVGRTWGQIEPAGPSLGLLKDVGIGLRIGNSRSGLGNMIHVDLALPLDGDSSIDNVQLLVETKQRF